MGLVGRRISTASDRMRTAWDSGEKVCRMTQGVC